MIKFTPIFNLIDRLSNYVADIVDNYRVQAFIRKCVDVVIDTIIRVCIIVFIVSVSLTIGPSIESRFVGVFNKWNADNYELVNGNWRFNVYATNPWYRFNCLYVSDQTIFAKAIVLNDGNEPSETIDGVIIPLKGSARITSEGNTRQYYGTWQLNADKPVPVGSIITGSIHHQCHILWATTTVFGPFQIRIAQ